MPVGASSTGESIVRLEDTSRSARRSSNAKSGMEGNRSDGFFAIARRNSSSTDSGTSGRLSGGTGWERMMLRSCALDRGRYPYSNGDVPASKAYSNAAREYMSVPSHGLRCASDSGADQGIE